MRRKISSYMVTARERMHACIRVCMYALGDVSGAARKRDSAPFRNMASKVTLRERAGFWLVVITGVLVWPSRAVSRQCSGTGYGRSFPSDMTRSLLHQPQSL